MAETSVSIQPAATATQPSAPQQLKLFSVNDGLGIGGSVLVQAVCLVDDQGRAYKPLTEDTGKQIVVLLQQLLQVTCEGGAGGQLPPDAAF
jgi:hypothetical protein